jgi:hypothetical protein
MGVLSGLIVLGILFLGRLAPNYGLGPAKAIVVTILYAAGKGPKLGDYRRIYTVGSLS